MITCGIKYYSFVPNSAPLIVLSVSLVSLGESILLLIKRTRNKLCIASNFTAI